MIKIFYQQKSSAVEKAVPSLEKAREVLENLWKARIEARAIDTEREPDFNEVGAVWKNEGHLTWMCE